MAWPRQPLGGKLAERFEQGGAFHQVLERHFLGLPIVFDDDADPEIVRWWEVFQAQPPKLPDGRRFPEMSLSVPVGTIDEQGEHFLFGRFDLLILNHDHAHIFDWKTERRPRKEWELKSNWQTRLYLSMLVEGSAAFERSYAPEQVAITYWFAEAPGQSVTIQYDRRQHARNRAEIRATVGRIVRRLAAPDAIWPLTDNFDSCRRCEFRTFCGRELNPLELEENALEMMAEGWTNEVIQEPPMPEETVL